MELVRAPLHFASPTVDGARPAGIITLVGSSCAILGGIPAWSGRASPGDPPPAGDIEVPRR